MPPTTICSRSARQSSSEFLGMCCCDLVSTRRQFSCFVLGPRFEENFRRAMLISRGDIGVFVERPISAVFIGLCVLLIALQIYVRLRGPQERHCDSASARVRRIVRSVTAHGALPLP